MKISVSPVHGSILPSCVATDSSARSVVVPTATTRPPRLRAAAIVSAVGMRNREALTVHAMLRQVLALDRLEGACADVQGEVRERDATRLETRKHRRVEMQSRGRRSDRARIARVDGLVALAVVVVGGTRDIRRQRHFAVAFEIVDQRHVGVETKPEKAPVALQRGRARSVGQLDAGTDARRMAGAKLHPRFIRRDDALEHEFDAAAGGFAAEQP